MSTANFPGSVFTETQFARWMKGWADAISAAPGWRELTYYRGVSALDAGYMHMYFRVLDQVRPVFDPEERALVKDREPEQAGSFERLRRIGRRLHRGELTVGDVVPLAVERVADRCRMALPPASVPALGPERTALVVAAAPNATAFPVLESLRDEFGWRCAFASWSRTVAPRVHALGIPYFHLADTYRRHYVSLRRRHEAEVASALARLDARDLTSALSGIAGTSIRADLSSLIHEVCCETRVQTDLYFDLFTRTSPAVLILFNEASLRERPAARVATQVGLKSVTLQHGLFIGHVYRSLATDTVIVWGRIPREFWLARGCAPEQVISVGAYGHERWGLDPPVRNAAHPGAEPATVLFLGQNPAAFISRSLYQASLRAAIDSARRLANVRFVIKPHPGESAAPYQEAVRSSRLSNVELVTDGDLVLLLREADIVLTVFSTAGLEAMLHGTPVVVVNPSMEPSLAPYASVMPTVGSSEALTDAIDRILRDAEHRASLCAAARRYAADYFGSLEGAARRAAATIDRLSGADETQPTHRARVVAAPRA